MGYDYQKMDKLISEFGMSKYSFFRQIGISEKTFSRWLSGSEIPKEATVRKIAGCLGVSLADLRTKNETNEPILEPRHKDTNKSNILTFESTSQKEYNKKDDFSFSSAELDRYRGHSACIIFDTCSIMNAPDLLEFVNGEELLVVPKVVLDELENNKRKYNYNDAGRAAQKAISAIYKYKRLYPLVMADDNIELIPETYRAKNGESESNDNRILSVVIRHKLYMPLPVLFITNDYSLFLKASSQSVTVCTAEEFIRGDIPPFPPFEWENNPGEKQETDSHEYDPLLRLKQAEENGEFNKVILYAIILKKVSRIRKYITGQIDDPIKDLAELYISLRAKKDVPAKKKVTYAELKTFAAKYIDEDNMEALAVSFSAAYRDALSSLSGSIKQIVGDLE